MNMIHRITFSIQTTFHGLPFFYIILWSFNKSNVFACIFAVVHLIFSYEFLYEQGCTPSWLNRPLPSNHPTSILWTKRTLVFIYVSNSKIKRISWIWRVVYSSFSTSFYFSRFGGHPTHGENGFRVKTLAGKEFLMLCDTEEDCETWCSTIQAAIDRSASSVDSEKPTSFPLQVSPGFCLAPRRFIVQPPRIFILDFQSYLLRICDGFGTHIQIFESMSTYRKNQPK